MWVDSGITNATFSASALAASSGARRDEPSMRPRVAALRVRVRVTSARSHIHTTIASHCRCSPALTG